MRNNNTYMSPPVKEGEEFNLTIEAVGKKGDGIAKINGYTIFVPKTKPDDKVKVKITKVMDNFAFGEVTAEESESNNTPDVPEDTEDFGNE